MARSAEYVFCCSLIKGFKHFRAQFKGGIPFSFVRDFCLAQKAEEKRLKDEARRLKAHNAPTKAQKLLVEVKKSFIIFAGTWDYQRNS
jgi:hypothetical protein